MILCLPDSWSNWNLKMLVFEERGKPEYPEKNLSEQWREPTTNSTHVWCRRRDLNPGHIGGRRVLSPLRHPLLPLGVIWCTESDTFNFRIKLKDKPCTRRGILSTISSIYDPLGFIAPVVLVGKYILQDTCHTNSWDEPVDDVPRSRWEKWRMKVWKY